MNPTRAAIGNPTAVISAVLLVLLFGTLSLQRLPRQMIPDIEQPTIQIVTTWRAAAPDEIEAEIIEQQEDALRGVQGVERIVATASRGRGDVSLRFGVDIELNRALIDVMNRLNRVPSYPPDTDEPVIYAGQDQFGQAIAWFSLKPLPGNDADITGYQEYIEEVIQPRLERVKGIAATNAFGGRGRELRVTFDPYRTAAHGITLPEIVRVTGNNTDTSAGFTEVGRRQYTVRYTGGYSVDDFADMVLAWRGGTPVRLRDVAEVDFALRDRGGMLVQSGGPSVALNAQAEKGVNVLEVMDGLRAAVAELNEGPLARSQLELQQVYDETVYIEQSISMLRTNLLLGIALAIAILWWFLRRLRATALVALAIPVSLFGAFALLDIGGRSLNIISLAGLAFAMGMVLDAAIVVLENIVRLRESGEASEHAAEHGTGQVFGALIASTATTVAIFLPIIFLRDVAGQLFADLAFTIAAAVVLSLIIAVTIIPTAATTWLRGVKLEDPHRSWWENGTQLIMSLTGTRARRLSWIYGLIVGALGITYWLLPEADYLPQGKQNFAFGFILPPPGNSVDSIEAEFIEPVIERLEPYIDGSVEYGMSHYFLGVFGSFGFWGFQAKDPGDMDRLLGEMNSQAFLGFPDTMVFTNRAPIFGRLGGGRQIDMNLQSSNIDSAMAAARTGFGLISQALPGASIRPQPGLELAEPELRLVPNERRIAEVGWTRNDMAGIIRALGDGLYVGDYFTGDKRLDVIVRAREWHDPEQLGAQPLATPDGGVVPISELIHLERTVGPDQIRRVDRRRTITLRITPPEEMSIEATLATLREDVEPTLRERLPADGEISYYGSADNLKVALNNMLRSLALAVVILYLLMSALFRSFRDSLLVILALPLATVGGVLGVFLVDKVTPQAMDLLTMIGFITLLGLVVNNAILLVHQTRRSERDGMGRRESVEHAVRIRLRPILMSTLTSLFGMLPLLVIPGAGTEVYRGLAAVIVGGMTVSTVFTLVLLPSLLRLGETSAGLAGVGREESLEGAYGSR